MQEKYKTHLCWGVEKSLQAVNIQKKAQNHRQNSRRLKASMKALKLNRDPVRDLKD